jgi:hypothetical protein
MEEAFRLGSSASLWLEGIRFGAIQVVDAITVPMWSWQDAERKKESQSQR